MAAPRTLADLPLLRTLALPVEGGHVLQVQEFGRADGIPALVLHGGPGSGCSPLLRRFFDPRHYRVICVDQRGAGNSRPHGAIEHNTTDDLLADLRQLRKYLGITRWLVSGGSWGATLAVAHAAAEPAVVSGLLLRSSFLARREDVEWFFQGAAEVFPQAWQRLAAVVAPTLRGALLDAFAEVLCRGSAADQQRVALAWWAWEQTLASGIAGAPAPQGDALDGCVARYRVQSHYLRHGCWLTAPTLLERCDAVPRVPTLLIHARDDLVCRREGAAALHARLPGSQLQWLDSGRHDPAHPAMAAATAAALDRFAATSEFVVHP